MLSSASSKSNGAEKCRTACGIHIRDSRNSREAGRTFPPLASPAWLPMRFVKLWNCCVIRSGSSFALIGSALLMLIFGFGISTDVDNLSFAVLDRDLTPESRAYIQQFTGSRYFTEKQPIKDYADLEHRLQDGDIGAAIELPPGFGRDIMRGRTVSVAAWIDGAMPFRAETVRGYIEGTHQKFVSDLEIRDHVTAASQPVAEVKTRFLYNQDFDSVYAMVPATLALLLALIPATLMALAIVREKELGSITNLYVTPVTRIEFLLGKQLPYIALAMVNFGLMVLMALFVFGVPLEGKLSRPCPWGLSVCGSDDKLRHADLRFCAHPNRGAVRHNDPNHPSGDAVLGNADASVVAGRRRGAYGTSFPNELFLAHQRRHVHERSRLCRSFYLSPRARCLFPDVHPLKSATAAQAGTLKGSHAQREQHILARAQRAA